MSAHKDVDQPKASSKLVKGAASKLEGPSSTQPMQFPLEGSCKVGLRLI